MTQNQPHPSADGILAASKSIDPVFTNSPLIEQQTANTVLGLRLLAKVETLNPIRSFKGRGTDWWMRNEPAGDHPVVSASAGNFGQGLAYAGRAQGRKVVIFSATTANPGKIEAMRRLGAEVRLEGTDFDAAKAAARAYAQANGCPFVEDGALRTIAEGAGTIALEITEHLSRDAVDLDAILVPLGNGALLTGIGTWIRARAPNCKVIGVVAANAPAMKQSWETNRLISTKTAATAADGIAVRECVPYALDCMRTTVDEVWEASEAAIRQARDFCRIHYGLVVEEAGAAGIAGLLEKGANLKGRTVATILCGGNVRTDIA
ncbi:threonine/serine dehydratase [Neorhizobium galegae]|uniref:threonine ammonia-lyase n=1 Tax=Neorhizobium galegae TaxID=399 RepID=UPI0006216C45|nr:pyridoxal-phosphate dependent enzyme [Neorhizobium galegae]CDZ25229.1 Threonine ammonia-lyase [Neorhizobium galegae bv. officinalis]KAA9387897.1 pyridoxal-phosphate dependent enzyme [Neorhizobium galegae]KAB1115632.1 pyridoxal-phosphate dependent enzyme [Neorhizobium galegae]MCM2498170.1 pyridoxal-phosphate dependent enzyme [Neorhizobium galegae]MCQ1774139.1 pyridoxal-phosphate dependent enzyme [Neorhizobium galegae]